MVVTSIEATLEAVQDKVDATQLSAIKAVLGGASLFITGQAGTGKSLVLRTLVQALTLRGLTFAVTSSTGVSALLVNGCTLDSLFWMFPGIEEKLHPSQLASRLLGRRRPAPESSRGKFLQDLDCLIIDEISMISGKKLDYIDAILRTLRKSSEPFGGVQVVFFGDFYQLPPVPKQNLYAFQSDVWTSDILLCRLSTVYRQQHDKQYAELLNRVSRGCATRSDEALLRQCRDTVFPDDGILPTYLYSKKVDVSKVNQEKLEALDPTYQFVYMADSRITVDHEHVADLSPAQRTKKRAQLKQKAEKAISGDSTWPLKLTLRVGAQVMLLTNKYITTQGLANGSRGVVLGLSASGVRVRFANGHDLTVTKQVRNFGDRAHRGWTASVTQIPLCLAWAMTIHKSQGATLDRVVTSLGFRDIVFEPRVAYVALSRVRSFKDIKILDMCTSLMKRDEVLEKFLGSCPRVAPAQIEIK